MAAAAASSSLQARQMTNHMQGLLLIQYLLAVVSGEMHHTELQMGKAFIVIQAVLALAAGSEVPSSLICQASTTWLSMFPGPAGMNVSVHNELHGFQLQGLHRVFSTLKSSDKWSEW